ncbi:MAG: hypothetical protein M3Y17_15355 [Actinomycetota bacterium]|nr:hypothetical protein [Actinomycetota bacterium]
MLDLRETTQAKYRCIVNGEQLEQTIAAAHEPFGTLFTVAALTGARISELCGLTWADVRVDNLGDAEIEFGWQVDRHGSRRPMETDGSARTVPIPRELALVLAGHRRGARYTAAEASCSRPAPAGRCSSATSRGLWAAQRRALDPDGGPTFPILHEVDGEGEPVSVPRGMLPSMHSFRHTVASRAACRRERRRSRLPARSRRRDCHAEVYVREIADVRRRSCAGRG